MCVLGSGRAACPCPERGIGARFGLRGAGAPAPPSRPEARPQAPEAGREAGLKKAFFPKGAIASFLVMIGVYLVVWFALYFVMLSSG